MKTALIPHSSATTSWALLEDVIKAIEEEPRRFNWGEAGLGIDRKRGETPAEYAARGIAAIRLFMAKHEEALKAYTIHIPRREDA